MDWIRENKSLAAIVFIGLAGVLGLGFLLFQGYSAYAGSMDTYAAATGNLNRLKSAPLTPSDENLAAKEAAVKEYQGVADKLRAVLLALQPKEEPMAPTGFQAKLKSLVAETKTQAASKGARLPQDFAFGFEEYTGSLPATADAASKLSTYLDAVHAITQLMLDSGVKVITTMERTPLEAEKGEAKKPEPKGRPRPPQRGAQRRPAPPPPPKVTETRTVELTAVMDQVPLQLLMNQLASPSGMPFFTVVRNLRLENDKQSGPMRSDVVIPASFDETALENDEEDEDPNVIKAAKPDPVDSVAVMGNESLRVYMEIDLVRVSPPAAAPAQAGQ